MDSPSARLEVRDERSKDMMSRFNPARHVDVYTYEHCTRQSVSLISKLTGICSDVHCQGLINEKTTTPCTISPPLSFLSRCGLADSDGGKIVKSGLSGFHWGNNHDDAV